MTVSELIKKLKLYPDDLIVSVSGYERGFTDTFFLYYREIFLNVNRADWAGEHDLSGRGLPTNTKRGERLIISRNEQDEK